MKIKKVNAASKRTDEAIKRAFVELVNEKKELQKISITELVKRAGITRSAFYTHFDNIYDVAKEFQDETLTMILDDSYEFKTIEDVYKYVDDITEHLKENQETYRMLLSSNDPLVFFEKIRIQIVNKMYDLLVKTINTNETTKLDVEFFVDGILAQLLKHFRMNNYYSIDMIAKNSKEWVTKLFLK